MYLQSIIPDQAVCLLISTCTSTTAVYLCSKAIFLDTLRLECGVVGAGDLFMWLGFYKVLFSCSPLTGKLPLDARKVEAPYSPTTTRQQVSSSVSHLLGGLPVISGVA